MNKVEHLILSSTLDFSTDYVCYELERRKLPYLRLNRDRFLHYKICYFNKNNGMIVKLGDTEYIVDQEHLQSVFFRSPVFIRSNKSYPVDMQLYRSQWSSFIRNLTVFDKAKWMNHPMYTFQAENKMYQLEIAKKVGLTIPETIITNDIDVLRDDVTYVVKALDTPLFYEDGQEMFTYSTVVTGKEIKDSSIREAPVIIQNCIQDKVDIRVTIIGNQIFPAMITKEGKGIEGDWRKTRKEDLQYNKCFLPREMEEMLIQLMRELHLSFGGIDLTLSGNQYYFIEVNPTGEWGWLVKTAACEIHKSIVDWMIK